jgi:hypothetical protein
MAITTYIRPKPSITARAKVIKYSNTAPTDTNVVWFDTTIEKSKIYNPSKNVWEEIATSNQPVISSDVAPSDTSVVWFDTSMEKPRIYNSINSKWGIITGYLFGSTAFDNNCGGEWTNYINIPITTTSTESIQYKIEIDGDNINIYSSDGTTILTTTTGGLDFWSKVQLDGKDIRVFDETYSQNYFWVEKFDYTNKKCIIWCKINAGQEQLNIAYGNDSCLISGYNDGNLTFEFFDDFENDLSKWNTLGTPTISNGELVLSWNGTFGYVYTNIGLASNYVIESKWKYIGSSRAILNFPFSCDSTGKGYAVNFDTYTGDYCNLYSMSGWTTWTVTSPYMYYTPAKDVYHKSIIKVTNDVVEIYNDKEKYGGFNITPTNTFIGINPDKGEYHTSYVNYIFIRKYIDQDLTFGTPTIKRF